MNISRWQFYFVVLVPAAVLMALEIVSSRLLAPQFGNSVYVWGSIIGVFLAAMSAGYAWGGYLADRHPAVVTLGHLVLAAGVVQSFMILSGHWLVEKLGSLTGGSPTGTLLTVGILFAPATMFLAAVSPYAVKLSTRDLSLLGGTAGNLFALSTAASLVGTLCATFVMIPLIQLDNIFRLLLALTATASLVAFLSEGRRRSQEILLGLLLLAFSGLGWSIGNTGSQYLVERMTPYQTIRIYESSGIRFMTGDGIIQSAVDFKTGKPWLSYPLQSPTALLIQPEIDRMLVLGIGAGSVGVAMRQQLPELQIDYVDIDPAVPELSGEFMLFTTDEHSAVHIDDARRFLQNTSETWDYIYADTYIGLSVPFHLTTIEFMREVREHLASGGVFGLNLAAGLDHPFVRAIIRSAGETFKNVAIFGIHGSSNQLILATDSPVSRSRDEYIAVARQLESRFRFEPSLVRMAGWFVQLDLNLTDAYLLTDQFAPVSHLLQLDGDTEGVFDLPSPKLPRLSEPSQPEPSQPEPSQLKP
jgi:spermidine synthase